MSLLIKGMEMPTRCGQCRFFAWSRGVGQHCAVDSDITFHATIDGMDVKYERNGDCPLVPVPPHGRLIDADELSEDLNFDVENDLRALDDLDIVGKERAHIQFDKDCKQNCMYYLSNCPTVIPAEEVQE